jgi:hypothetical protein
MSAAARPAQSRDALQERAVILNLQQLLAVDLENGWDRASEECATCESRGRTETVEVFSAKAYCFEMLAYPTWNRTFGPMQKKQSIIRNAKTIGMLLMNLGGVLGMATQHSMLLTN